MIRRETRLVNVGWYRDHPQAEAAAIMWRWSIFGVKTPWKIGRQHTTPFSDEFLRRELA